MSMGTRYNILGIVIECHNCILQDPIDLVEVPCICSEPEGNSGMLVSSPDPKGQLEDFRLTEAKQNVENPEGFPGDIGASGASEEFEGKADGPLSPFEAIGFQEAVGCDYDVGPKEDTMVRPCAHQCPFIV